jgi:hypothetical protein
LIQRWPQNSVIVRREECLRFRASLSTGSRKDCQDSNMSRTNQIKRKRHHQKRMSRERNVKEKSSKSKRNGCDNQAMKFRLGSPIFPPFGPTSITRLRPGLYWYLYSKYPVLTPSSAPAGRHKRSWPGSWVIFNKVGCIFCSSRINV